MGQAMAPVDLSSLNNIYKILQDPENNMQTSYILHFYGGPHQQLRYCWAVFYILNICREQIVTACIFDIIF